VIQFMEKTWFLWSIFATIVLLRWFHVSSFHREESALDPSDSDDRQS
jgi:hypothetical protein